MNEAESGRFAGVARLYGAEGLARLRRAHVAIVGIGGVGSWAVEALARSGIGALTLVDLDEVCVTNINRQIHALDDTVGRAKVAVMAERVRSINPDCQVTAVQEFFTEANGESLLVSFAGGGGALHIIDAIDSVTHKTLLIALCRQREIPLVVCGGAGGRRDATAVRLADLADASHDRLLTAVRRRLRAEHGFPAAGQPMGVACVYSPESPVLPERPATACDDDDPTDAGQPPRLNCDWGYGSAAFVTGAFGFAAAARVTRQIAGEPGAR